MARADIKAPQQDTHLEIGVVARPHGVRGELKVRLHFEGSTALRQASEVILRSPRDEGTSWEVESVRGGPRGLILALSGIESRTQAEAVRGHSLWIERVAVAPLEEGEYYLIDLVGCQVELNGAPFACVIDVRPDPSVDTMVLELLDGRRAEVPLVDAWIGPVDVAARRVILLSREGVIEE